MRAGLIAGIVGVVFSVSVIVLMIYTQVKYWKYMRYLKKNTQKILLLKNGQKLLFLKNGQKVLLQPNYNYINDTTTVYNNTNGINDDNDINHATDFDNNFSSGFNNNINIITGLDHSMDTLMDPSYSFADSNVYHISDPNNNW